MEVVNFTGVAACVVGPMFHLMRFIEPLVAKLSSHSLV